MADVFGGRHRGVPAREITGLPTRESAGTEGFADLEGEELLRMLMELMDPFSQENMQVRVQGAEGTPGKRLMRFSRTPGLSKGNLESALGLMEVQGKMGEQERLKAESDIKRKLFDVDETTGGTITFGDETETIRPQHLTIREKAAVLAGPRGFDGRGDGRGGIVGLQYQERNPL